MSAPGTAARLDVLAPVLVVIGMVSAVAGPIFASSHVTHRRLARPAPAAGRDGEPPLDASGATASGPGTRLIASATSC